MSPPEWTTPGGAIFSSSPLVGTKMCSKIKSRKGSVESTHSVLEEENARELTMKMNLPGIMNLCARLSNKNKNIRAYIVAPTEASQMALKKWTNWKRRLKLSRLKWPK